MKPRKYSYRFEPNKDIRTPKEFTKEIIKFCEDNKKELTVIRECMEPIVIIDKKKYTCLLEPIFTGKNYGFKWVYMYED